MNIYCNFMFSVMDCFKSHSRFGMDRPYTLPVFSLPVWVIASGICTVSEYLIEKKYSMVQKN